jgi:hypothetical protein
MTQKQTDGKKRINHEYSKEDYNLHELQEQLSEKHHVEINFLKLPKEIKYALHHSPGIIFSIKFSNIIIFLKKKPYPFPTILCQLPPLMFTLLIRPDFQIRKYNSR